MPETFDRTLRLTDPGGASTLRLRSAFLESASGETRFPRTRVDGRVIRIGSAPDQDVVLTDPSVSREHALIEDREEGFRIRDQGSTNGTWVNGMRIHDGILPPDATLRFGAVEATFQLETTSIDGHEWPEDQYHGLVGGSAPMRRMFTFLDRIARTDLPVLLLGETGTGKEEIARALHEASPRGERPLVVFDGATTEATFMAATLFGHREGAFTGASHARDGCFLAAHSGTLFLDEVGEIPLDLQPRLLRALERGEITPLGVDTPTRVDVRIVAATHRDLQGMVREGTFREDLYYRLSGVVLEVPALRDRGDDVIRIARHLLEAGPRSLRLGVSAHRALTAHSWPGNVRELKNTLARAAALAPGDALEARDLSMGPVRFTDPPPPPASTATPEAGPPQTLDERERIAILEVLESTDGNITLTAEILGITRQTLRRKLNRYGIGKVGS